MPTATLAPDAIVSSSNLSGAVTDVDEAVGAAYTANPVNFDGTNDYLTTGAALTGAADSKLFTGSFWIRRLTAGTAQRLFSPASDRIRLEFLTGNTLQWRLTNAVPVVICDIRTITTFSTTWKHVVFSFDMANQAGSKIYINDVLETGTVISFVDGSLDLTDTNWAIGALTSGTVKLSADVADVQFWFGSYIDLTVIANRRLFIRADGAPQDPAIAAASSLGTPIIRLSGATDTWHTNDGSGGGFTMNGALTDGTGPVQL